MPFIPQEWRQPLHHINHPLGEYHHYRYKGEDIKVLRANRETGFAYRTTTAINGRTTIWSARVDFADDGAFVHPFVDAQTLTMDGSLYKIKHLELADRREPIHYVGLWYGN